MDCGVLLEELAGTDALQNPYTLRYRDAGRKRNEGVHMIRRNFNFKDVDIIVVPALGDTLFEYGAIRLGEYRMTVLWGPYQMVYKAIDMVFGTLKVHTMDSISRLRRVRYPSRGQAPAVSASRLNSDYRINQWKHTQEIIKKLKQILPITSIRIVGSFTTKKETPGDIDCIIFIKTEEKSQNAKWAIDLTIAPDNDYGKKVLFETEEWVKQKYGIKKSPTIKLI